ncbi:MAG: bifunctional enoyl-CoA hydratase/phosphate acetyltransferase [Oscillospiraceae bacterium]|nr:bifunctional enoyl-CoA hydratase/phosphate acetyltransferase [Oscillospiraceae bacterium]
MQTLDQLLQTAATREKSRVSVAVAEDATVLQAVAEAHRCGIAEFFLVGDTEAMTKVAEGGGIDLTPFTLLHESDPIEACRKAVALVAEGKASALMKGKIDTSIIMRAALDKEHGIRAGRKLSHLAAFELPTYHKLLYVTDAAINIQPDLATKKEIVQNAVDAVRNLGVDCPKVALLAAKEKVDEKMPVTVEWAELIASDTITDCILGGPLALDNAVSKESVAIKGITSPVGGDADILACPDIEAGNILYKALAFLANGRNGGVVVGAKRPIILTSRADSSENKLISIALGILF